jgi:hypothetical protein
MARWDPSFTAGWREFCRETAENRFSRQNSVTQGTCAIPKSRRLAACFWNGRHWTRTSNPLLVRSGQRSVDAGRIEVSPVTTGLSRWRGAVRGDDLGRARFHRASIPAQSRTRATLFS